VNGPRTNSPRSRPRSRDGRKNVQQNTTFLCRLADKKGASRNGGRALGGSVVERHRTLRERRRRNNGSCLRALPSFRS